MLCEMEEIEDERPDARGWRRVRCKRRGCQRRTNPTPHPLERIHFHCRVLGPGDYLSAFLAIWGVTPDRVNAIKKRLGLKPCKCGKRRDQFNELGRKLGL